MTELVPVVDLTSGDAVERIDDACRTVGFLSLANHGIPREVIDHMLFAASAFFALPYHEKAQWRSHRSDIDRGYVAKGAESLSYSLGKNAAPPDMFEAFAIGRNEPPAGTAAFDAGLERFFAANIWPDHPQTTDLRPALLAYLEHAQTLADRLTHLFALALGLDENFFVDKTDHSIDNLRVNYFERRPGDPDPIEGQQRLGAHTDYGVVTILYADPVPGLQIIGPDGAWHDVLPKEDHLLVNLGDLLAMWTNDHWRSTLHRVVPPPKSMQGPSTRRSVAFFHNGNHDAVVECLPTCQSQEDPAKYPSIQVGEHFLSKLVAPKTHAASIAVSTSGDRLRDS
jgi:isopenicillin N synthase-like dioxygenase